MIRVFAIAFLFLMVACNSDVEDAEGFITSSNGDEVIDTLESSEIEYDIAEQPLIVYYFFHLTAEQIGTDFCYDEKSVQDLLMGDIKDDYVWTNYLINDKYLRFENEECQITTEFGIILDGNTPTVALLQTGRNGQQIGFYFWNEGGQSWAEVENIPAPFLTDYFYGFEDGEQVMVDDYGQQFAYLNEQTLELSYLFSTWQMGLNMDGKEILDFDREPDFSYALAHDVQDGFSLKKIYENEALAPKRYFLAYSETGEISEDFSWFIDDIKSQLDDYNVEAVFADFSLTDYNAYFSTDTFNLAHMQQFEQRNGFWFYETHKEPLDLGYDMPASIVPLAKEYFDE